MGEDWQIDYNSEAKQVPGNPEHLVWMKKWIPVAERLLHEGKWRPHRQDIREGGFEGILQGLEDLKNGKISGVKVVYRVAEP